MLLCDTLDEGAVVFEFRLMLLDLKRSRDVASYLFSFLRIICWVFEPLTVFLLNFVHPLGQPGVYLLTLVSC